MEIIKNRRSVRTFDGNKLRSEDVGAIIEFAKTTGNPYNIPVKWCFLDAKVNGLSTPVIKGTDTFIAGKLNRCPHAEEAFGYSFEKIVLFAQSLGVGTTWIAGTMDRHSFEQAVELKPGEVMPCISPLGYPAAKMSIRETIMRKGVKADWRMDFSELFFDGSFDKPLTSENSGILSEALEMVRWAPSAVNKQPWRVVVDGNKVHFYEKKAKGYVNPEGWDLQKVDLGIALCHFHCGLEDRQINAEFVIADPGIQKPQDVEYIASYVLQES